MFKKNLSSISQKMISKSFNASLVSDAPTVSSSYRHQQSNLVKKQKSLVSMLQ